MAGIYTAVNTAKFYASACVDSAYVRAAIGNAMSIGRSGDELKLSMSVRITDMSIRSISSINCVSRLDAYAMTGRC